MRRRDEQIVATLCHLGNAIPLWGLIVCGWIMFDNREKSRYLVAQARQAMYFHGILLAGILVCIWFRVFSSLVGFVFPPLRGIMIGFNQIVLLLLLAVHFVICARGAWRCWMGEPFRYPIVKERMD